MTNIWEFLLQTGTVTVVALLLLLCKRIFADKLSPRWQYGIWCLLALRMLLPVQVDRNILLPLPLFAETLKATVEMAIGTSGYAWPYVPLSLTHVVPVVQTVPTSVTDWLFVVYAAGVMVSLLAVFVRYGRFLRALHQAADDRIAPSPETMAALVYVRETYGLNGKKSCPVQVVPGLSSPFVCGFFRPVLVLPTETVDKTVLLHELLHLQYRDVWQNLFWCVLRSLHWCNPVVLYVCRRIENDMESLCDTRVLERLAGEERRRYGTVLLSMVQEKYARAPGTTSVSNGGKNIARRIDAIVRFKKYPSGMGMVSVCMGLVLSIPFLWGSGMTYDDIVINPATPQAMQRSLATTRLKRCSTIAGALDTYAKGLISGNGILLTAAMPLENQEALAKTMDRYGNMPHSTDFGRYRSGEGYRIFNLTDAPEGGYEALLVFPVFDWEGMEETDDIGLPGSASLFVPVWVQQEEDSWVVTESGDRIRSFCDFNQTEFGNSPVPPLRHLTGEGKTGIVTIEERVLYEVDNTVEHSGLQFFSTKAFSDSPKPDAVFAKAICNVHLNYEYADSNMGILPETNVGVETIVWDGENMPALPLEIKRYVKEYGLVYENGMEPIEGWMAQSGSSSMGSGWVYDTVEANKPYRTLYWGSGEYYYGVEGPVELPTGYGALTYWDNRPMELFLMSDNESTVMEATEDVVTEVQ